MGGRGGLGGSVIPWFKAMGHRVEDGLGDKPGGEFPHWKTGSIKRLYF